MALLELMKQRHSVRSFKEDPISKSDLEQILEAGRVAPTAANKQTQRILVVNTKNGLEKIGESARTYNPPLIMILCSETAESWVNPHDGRDMNDIDLSIVSTHMMLMAKELGIDSLWVNWFDPEALYTQFDIPRKYKIINLLELGYSQKPPLSEIRHEKTRKPLKDTVFYNTFGK